MDEQLANFLAGRVTTSHKYWTNVQSATYLYYFLGRFRHQRSFPYLSYEPYSDFEVQNAKLYQVTRHLQFDPYNKFIFYMACDFERRIMALSQFQRGIKTVFSRAFNNYLRRSLNVTR